MSTATPTTLRLPERVELIEVGPRDGLQSLPQVVSTDDKVALVEAIVAAGVTTVEAVSFAHPKVLPQMADAEAVMARLERRPGVVYRGLVPNVRGATRAAGCGVDEMVCLVTCDDDLNLRNQGMDVETTLKQIEEIVALAGRSAIRTSAVIGLAFFTPGKGLTPFDRLLAVSRRLAALGIPRVSLAATSGMADPRQVFETVSRLRAELPSVRLGLHLHNRNGMALANALAGMQAGAEWLEGSILGVGGDAWFPGDLDVLGNVPMEDLVHLTASIGVSTGVDLDRYLEASRKAERMLGRKSAAFVVRGGTRAALVAHQWEP